MADKTSSNTAHWVLGVALLLIGVFVIIAIVLVNSQAADTSVSIDNAAPTIDTIFLSATSGGGVDDFGSGIDLTGGTTTTVYLNGVVEDTNGNADITSVSATARRSGITDANCDEVGEIDENHCKVVSSCTLSNPSGLIKNFDCAITLEYYADATDSGSYSAQSWIFTAEASDAAAATGLDTVTTEVNSLASLGYGETIDWSSLSLGDTTDDTDNAEQTITQAGNVQADALVSGTDLTCDTGTIPKGNVEWMLTDGSHGSGTDLSSSPVDTNLAVGVRTDGAVTKTLYWNIEIPANGVEGDCAGTITQSATAS